MLSFGGGVFGCVFSSSVVPALSSLRLQRELRV